MHARTLTHTHDSDIGKNRYFGKNKIQITLKDVLFFVTVHLNYYEISFQRHKKERGLYNLLNPENDVNNTQLPHYRKHIELSIEGTSRLVLC